MSPLPSSRNEAGSGTRRSRTALPGSPFSTLIERVGSLALGSGVMVMSRGNVVSISSIISCGETGLTKNPPSPAAGWKVCTKSPMLRIPEFGAPKVNVPETSEPAASVMSSCVPVGPVLENPTRL